MKNNSNQKELRGVDCIMRKFSFSELLNELCAKHGQGALADEIGIDPGAFSRFKNGEGNLSLKKIEALLSYSNMALIPKEDVKNLYISFFTVSDLLLKRSWSCEHFTIIRAPEGLYSGLTRQACVSLLTRHSLGVWPRT